MDKLFEKYAIDGVITKYSFQRMINDGIIKAKTVRDFEIREKYSELKKVFKQEKAIEILRVEYPYLQFDTLRKLIYS